jgi:hypothetical protein
MGLKVSLNLDESLDLTAINLISILWHYLAQRTTMKFKRIIHGFDVIENSKIILVMFSM